MLNEVRLESRYQFFTRFHDIDVCDNEGNTPLHTAVKEERLDIVKTVLLHGCNINHRNNNCETALHLASNRQLLNIMHMLLTAGANPNIQDGQRNTALHTFLQACILGPWETHEYKTNMMSMLRKMLAKGARSNIKNDQGKTAIHLAIKMGQQDVVEMLMEDAKRRDTVVMWVTLGVGVVFVLGLTVLVDKMMISKGSDTSG